MCLIRRFFAFLCTAVLLLSFPSARGEKEAPSGSVLRLHQIDVGSGDAYLLTVDDIVILVDCGINTQTPLGNGAKHPELNKYIASSGIDHIDAYFVTHWHNDHCYNVDYFLELYGTKNTVTYGVSSEFYPGLAPLPAGTYEQLIDGGHVRIGPLDVLCIGPVDQENLTGCVNQQSMNFIVTYGNHRFLFTGDWVDETVADRWPDEITDIDVLSFPHHGLEPMYITKKCYTMMNPRVVLIPGRGSYTVRKFVQSLGLPDSAVFLSGNNGHLLVTSDGDSLWVASRVQAGKFPLGDPVPPRTE